ncbi:MAG: MATE family efflux transporter [Oscillospiraceae bacterium]|nr:MATE family efflux transporter [Oscillospiraceae bacterium]
MTTERKKLHQLFFPIFFEILCMMLAGAVDTLMLSSEGDQAVGAVGTANTYIGVFIIMFSIISAGVVAVMTQYIGAGRPGVARQALRLGAGFNLIVGLFFTVVLCFCSGPILRAIGIADQLLEPAQTYMQVIGCFCLCNALTPVFSSYLRAFGHTAPTLYATITANIVNLCLNALFLFGFRWGVWGVALATGISRLVNLLWVVIAARGRIHVQADPAPPANREIFGQIVKVGLPAALETCLYNLAITLVISFLNQMDETGMQATARSYTMQIANFSYCVGAGLAHANAILAGWRIGAGELDECDRGTKQAAIIGIAVGAGCAALFAIFAKPIIGLFTDDPAMIGLVSTLLLVDIALEVGRVSNLVFGNALKISGDAVFPMVIAVVFAFLCAAGGTWFFGIRLGWLAVGAYIAMALDECVRAVCMFARWQSGVWRKRAFVSNK